MEAGALAIERRLAGQEQELQGALRTSSADWFGAYVLPPIIDDYARAYPHVDLKILTGARLFSLAQAGGRYRLPDRPVRQPRCRAATTGDVALRVADRSAHSTDDL